MLPTLLYVHITNYPVGVTYCYLPLPYITLCYLPLPTITKLCVTYQHVPSCVLPTTLLPPVGVTLPYYMYYQLPCWCYFSPTAVREMPLLIQLLIRLHFLWNKVFTIRSEWLPLGTETYLSRLSVANKLKLVTSLTRYITSVTSCYLHSVLPWVLPPLSLICCCGIQFPLVLSDNIQTRFGLIITITIDHN